MLLMFLYKGATFCKIDSLDHEFWCSLHKVSKRLHSIKCYFPFLRCRLANYSAHCSGSWGHRSGEQRTVLLVFGWCCRTYVFCWFSSKFYITSAECRLTSAYIHQPKSSKTAQASGAVISNTDCFLVLLELALKLFPSNPSCLIWGPDYVSSRGIR